jgi:predicted O-linked N-acetylglucosamine transferase (SPINDLY family)
MTIDVVIGSGDQQAAEGVALLAEGRFDEALIPLRLALALGDAHPATMLNLAIAEDRAGDRDHARRLMQAVANRLPHWEEPILRLAESYRAANDRHAAEDAYRHALDLNPNRPDALTALGGLMLLAKKPAEARDLLLSSCGLDPSNAETWDALGLAFKALNDPKMALTAFVKAQTLQPSVVSYVVNGVGVALEAEQVDGEMARLSVACDQDPLNPVFQIGRGMLLSRMGRQAEAIDALEAATELAPDAPAALTLLGALLTRSSRIQHAELVLRRLTLLSPNNPSLLNDHAVVLMRMHRHPEARALLLDVLERFGATTEVLCNLANATTCCGLQDEAVEVAHRAIGMAPASGYPRRALCTTLPYRDGTTGLDLLDATRAAAERLSRTPQPPLTNHPDPNRPITIGLLSGSLRAHPVGWLTVAGIETLDPDQFSVICLAQNDIPDDAIARRFHTASREWVNIDGISDAALTEAARKRGIDILIDLGGYGDAARMPACANRLAPVQVKWVGMQTHSTGMAEMDWFLTDRWETPDGFEPLYSERLLRLPDGYICYSPPPKAPDVVPLPALANGFVTFGCFNNVAKITARVVATWSAILRRLPDARLVLKTHQLADPATAERVRADFATHGIPAERLQLRGASGHRAFMGEYGDIDIVLDPFPYCGGLTTCEALWMGVPTITLPGDFFASRHSVSHLSNAGLPEWVTDSTDAYIEMAVARAANLPALATLRAGLRDKVRRSPLCDAPRFGRNLGAALRHAWQQWCLEQLQAEP